MKLSLQDITPDFMDALKAVMAVAQGRRQPTCWGYLGAGDFFQTKGLCLPRVAPRDKELSALNLLSEMHDQELYQRPMHQLPAFKGGMDTVIGYAGKYLLRAFGATLRERYTTLTDGSSKGLAFSPIRNLHDHESGNHPTNREVLMEIQRLRQEVHALLQPNAPRLSA